MLKFKMILLLLTGLLVGINSNAQTPPEYAIYQMLIKIYKGRTPKPATSLETFKDFNFKEQKDAHDTISNDWQLFLNNIYYSKIKSGRLDSTFLSNFRESANSGDLLRFSPILVSADKTKAVCGVHIFSSPPSYDSELMYLFEKRDAKWTYKRYYTIPSY